MRNFNEDLVKVLEYLYEMYDRYLWRNKNSKLEVLMQDEIISFYLMDNQEDIDEFLLSFSDKEKKLYTYICIRVMIMLFGNVIIHQDENVLYNEVHKPYLKLTVNDEDVLDAMTKIISMQDKLVISGKMDIVQEMKEDLPWRFYPKKFIRKLEERVMISEKLLKAGD